MTEMARIDRRTFLRRGGMGAGAFWALSLSTFMARRAHGSPLAASPYGPLSPKIDETTGLALLRLPDGFRYMSYSWTGDVMSDGVACPSLHDGMAVIDDEGDGLVLVRNHEQASGRPYVDKPSITYAADGAGGTTNLVFDPRSGRWQQAWSSLAGTSRNCSGGVTPWGTWVTCEETGETGHGWSFEVGPLAGSPKPLSDMGRFSHEALMIDPRTGYAYETEDAGSASGLYKFVPNQREGLAHGGALYMLAIKRRPNIDLGLPYAIGTTWDVQWVRINDPTAAAVSVFQQGYLKGGARFRRLEGAWWGERTGYFLSTNGGRVGEGQVFEYDPGGETLKLIYDSPSATEVDNPDNMTVTPRGGLLLCEDAAGNNFPAGDRLIGLTFEGETFTFAMNNLMLAQPYNSRVGPGDYRQAEWAGACYSPDGRWLFVNIQMPGVTFAITGPWGKGPL